MDGDTPAAALRQLGAPACILRRGVEHPLEIRPFLKQTPTIAIGILPGTLRKLVDTTNAFCELPTLRQNITGMCVFLRTHSTSRLATS